MTQLTDAQSDDGSSWINGLVADVESYNIAPDEAQVALLTTEFIRSARPTPRRTSKG